MGPRLVLSLLLAAAAAGAAAAAPAGPQGYDGTVAFQGSGTLLTYYSGVSQALQERKVVVAGKTPLAGLSGGAFTVASLAANKTGEDMFFFWKALFAFCGTNPSFNGSCTSRFNGILAPLMGDYLKPDAYKKVSGKVRIAISQLNGAQTGAGCLFNSSSWVVDRFVNDDDLIAALTSTDYIPCWTGVTLYTFFRNNPVIDGGYANGFQELCAKAKKGKCLKVSSYYVGPLGNTTCDPARCPIAAQNNCMTPERNGTITKLWRNDKIVDRQPLYRMIQRCPLEAWTGKSGPNPMPDFVPHNQTGFYPDLYPGKFNPLPDWDGQPMLACQWQQWGLNLPPGRELEAINLMYATGYKDGISWANANGFPA